MNYFLSCIQVKLSSSLVASSIVAIGNPSFSSQSLFSLGIMLSEEVYVLCWLL